MQLPSEFPICAPNQVAKLGGSKDMANRNLDAYYRRAQYEDFGGRPWCNILLATGDVDCLIVQCMETIRAEREGQAAPLAPTQGLSARLPRAQRPGPVRGVQHTSSEAKQARKAAKRLDKEVQAQKDLWNNDMRCMGWPEWERLVADRDRAWAHAMDLSERSGNPYYDQGGVLRNAEPKDMTGLALREWCKVQGIPYS